MMFDRESREGMVVVAEDDVFAIHAFSDSSQALDVGTSLTLSQLHLVLDHYEQKLGRRLRPSRRYSLYLHSPAHYQNEGGGAYPSGGMEWDDDLSADISWGGGDRLWHRGS